MYWYFWRQNDLIINFIFSMGGENVQERIKFYFFEDIVKKITQLTGRGMR